jgi:hypothetical protein
MFSFGNHRTRPFRIMCTALIPSNVRHAPKKKAVTLGEPNSFLYCPVVLFDPVVEIFALAQLTPAKIAGDATW